MNLKEINIVFETRESHRMFLIKWSGKASLRDDAVTFSRKGVQTEGIVNAKALRQEQAECVRRCQCGQNGEREEGSETEEEVARARSYKALEAVTMTEIYSKSIGKPPKGLEWGMT